MTLSTPVTTWAEGAIRSVAAEIVSVARGRASRDRDRTLARAGAFGLGCAVGVALALGPTRVKRLLERAVAYARRDDGGAVEVDIADMDGEARREAGFALEPFMEEALAEAWSEGR